jgi:hypothetical protein
MKTSELKEKMSDAFKQYVGVTTSDAESLLAVNGGGKIYEAYVLSLVVRDLSRHEGCKLTLVNGADIQLRTSHGPIDGSYSRIKVERQHSIVGEIWTDIEFTSLSYWRDPKNSSKLGAKPPPGSRHELDIILTTSNPEHYPTPDQVLIGIECKHTPYQKRMLREILGVRRELSYLNRPQATSFLNWPRSSVPAEPNSCLLAYSSSRLINNFTEPGTTFGIDFIHAPV